jgi:MFS family permease
VRKASDRLAALGAVSRKGKQDDARASRGWGEGESGRWLVVLVGFLILSMAFSARAMLGLSMPALEGEFGWSRSFVSLGAALALLVTGFMSPVAGNFADRAGPRRMLALGLAIIACGMALTAFATDRTLFLIGYSLVAGVGFGIVALHVVTTMVAQRFAENRGLATGVATSGSTAGQLLVVPLLALVMTQFGWRESYGTVALATLVLAPVVLLAIRPARAGSPAAAAAAVPAEPLGKRLRFLLRNRVFHALFWSFVICGFTTAGVIETHLLPYAAACGFPPLQSATAYGVLSAFNMVGMVAAGWLADRGHRPFLLGMVYIVRALSFLLLMRIVGDTTLLFTFAVIFGLFDYSTVPFTASLVASHIGLRIMGLTMGLLVLGHGLGAAVGSFLGGVLYDLFARYEAVWIASVALALLAGLICFTIRENRGSAPGLAPQPA